MENQEKEKNIAIYGRVSTARQEEEGTIETQLSAVKEYAKKHNLTIVKEYIDEGWSGDTIIRPSLDRLRMEAKSKFWQAVLIYDPDRLARRYSYQELVMDELREAGIEVIFVTTPAPKNSEDKILYGVKGLFAEYERAKIAERFRLGKLRSVNQGNVLMSTPPFGYSRIGKTTDKKAYFVVNDEEAEIVKKIFSWVADDNLTIRAIVFKLKELNIQPRKGGMRGSGFWSPSTVKQMIKNKAYIGETRFASTQRVLPTKPIKTDIYKKYKKTGIVHKPESEWIKIPFPRILDDELFRRANEALTGRRLTVVRTQGKKYLMAGKLYCTCGGRASGKGSFQRKSQFYICNKLHNSFPHKTTCPVRPYNAGTADGLVWQRLVELMSSEKFLEQQINVLLDERKNIEKVQKNVESEKKQLEKLSQQEERYITAYGAGAITVEQLKEYTTSIKEKKLLLKEEIDKINTEIENRKVTVIPNKEDIKKFVEIARVGLLNLDFENRQKVFNGVVRKVVGDGEQLTVSGLIPIESLASLIPSPYNGTADYCSTVSYLPRKIEHHDTSGVPFELKVILPPPQKRGAKKGHVGHWYPRKTVV